MTNSNATPKASTQANPIRAIHRNFVLAKLYEFRGRKDRLKSIRATAPIYESLKLKLITEVDDFLRTYCFGAEGFSRSDDFRILMVEIEMMQPRN